MRIKAVLMALACVASIHAEDTQTGIFSPEFKSLQIYGAENPLMPPLLQLGAANSRIVLSFDEIAESNRWLRYSLLHCDESWRPSDISETDYLDGFNLGDITDFELSEQTLAHYVHYSLTLPQPDMMPLLSGNYLVRVFDDDNPDEILLQARFMVSENSAALSVKVTTATDFDYNSRHQQLEVEANLEYAKVADPFNDLSLKIIQNGHITHTLDKPQRVMPPRAIYAHQRPLIFTAGNEYRRFDTANLRYPGRNVAEIMAGNELYHVKLTTDQPRAFRAYIYDEDQAGRYFPDNFGTTKPDIDADYVVTSFELQMPELTSGNVYLEGDLTNRRLDSDSRMVYDKRRGAYVKTLLLKQGMYNYQYVVRPAMADESHVIEGDYYETVNEYLLLLYYNPPGARYTRLIGTTLINSTK